MTIFLTFVDYTLFMKVKLIECTHELDLQDEINDFLKLAAYIYLAHCLYLLASKFSISEMQFDGISS